MQRDRWTDITKLIVIFLTFVNVPKTVDIDGLLPYLLSLLQHSGMSHLKNNPG